MAAEISPEKLSRYLAISAKALAKVKIAPSKEINWRKNGEEFLDMATRYIEDARHFQAKGDFVNAFACVNYAHGWLDAGARLGLFDVGHDSVLFSVDGEPMGMSRDNSAARQGND
ncbi:DUF357 domain-containing protein [Candidatus Woesearchaeota archaeon]|nr:DUF357 domain-containing protein [Candidatus Woesearchaeota archaeon]